MKGYDAHFELPDDELEDRDYVSFTIKVGEEEKASTCLTMAEALKIGIKLCEIAIKNLAKDELDALKK